MDSEQQPASSCLSLQLTTLGAGHKKAELTAEISFFGNPAISLTALKRPEVFRPCFATGLAFRLTNELQC